MLGSAANRVGLAAVVWLCDEEPDGEQIERSVWNPLGAEQLDPMDSLIR